MVSGPTLSSVRYVALCCVTNHCVVVQSHFIILLTLSVSMLQQEVRFVETANHTKDRDQGCGDEREDYFECLHSKKEFARIRTVVEEQKAQEYETKHGVRPVSTVPGAAH